MEPNEQNLARKQMLSMVIPVYFNADSLPTFTAELKKFETDLAKQNIDLELIFVDDGSGDKSFHKLLTYKKQRPGTKVLRLSRNFGAPAALKTGLKFVAGDCFMFFAADLQEPLEQVLRMVEEWKRGNKLVISARESRADPLMTRLFAAISRALVRLTVRRDYPSGGIGLVLMDKIMLPLMTSSAKNINPNVYAFWLGFDPKILTYDRLKRIHGKSRWSFRKRLNYFIDTITGFSVVPIRLITGMGFITAATSLVYAAYIFIAAIFGQIPVTGFATLIIVIAFLGGCIMIMLGIIGEYLWRIFDQVSGKPEAVIAEEHL